MEDILASEAIMADNSVDLAYVIDTTGSMSAYLKQAKNTIRGVLREVTEQHPGYSMRFACVSYKDWIDTTKRIEFMDFVDDPIQIKTFLHTVKAKGGGDECEDVLGGLNQVTQLDWRSSVRVIYHICDAPPHHTMYHDGCNDNWKLGYDGDKYGGPADPENYHEVVLNAMHKQRINLYSIAKMNSSVDKMIGVFKGYAETLPLEIEERDLKNASNLLVSVVKVISTAIDAIELVSAPAIDCEIVGRSGKLFNPYRIKNTYKAWVGIDFGTEGTGFAYSLADGEIYWQQTWTKIATEKDLTNILLRKRVKPGKGTVYSCVGFGRDANDKYTKQKKYRECLFFRRFKMALYDQELSFHRSKEEEERKAAELAAARAAAAEAGADDDSKAALLESDTDSDDDYDYEDDPRDETCLVATNGEKVPTRIVFAQALKYMRKVIMNTLNEGPSGLVMNVTDVQWILTVPAIWSNHAKQMMRDAAFDAGMTREVLHDHLQIATEPECASVIGRKDLRELLKEGDKYILLDLGGGTADIACHQICGDNRIEQILPPQGGSWGSSYIDQEYLKFLSLLFGDANMSAYHQFLLESKKAQDWIELTNKFRASKHEYNGKDTHTVELPLSLIRFMKKQLVKEAVAESAAAAADGAEDERKDGGGGEEDGDELFEERVSNFEYKGASEMIDLDENMLELSLEIWNDLFATVVDPILDMTAKILLKNPKMEGTKHILLVGGLSSSVYVQSCIHGAFGEHFNVHTIPRPILAVVSGACEYGLHPTKLSTKCFVQCTIGIEIRRPWMEGDPDDPRIKVFDDTKKQYMISGAFHKLYEIGTTIDTSEQTPLQYFKPTNANLEEQSEVRIQLYQSERPNPVLVNEAGCVPMCEPMIAPLPDHWNSADSIPIQFWYSGTEFRVFVAAAKWNANYRNVRIKWKDRFAGKAGK